MIEARTFGPKWRRLAICWVAALLCALMLGLTTTAHAQPKDDNISAALVADGPPVPGDTWMLALHFTPRSEEWHGYWSNPGDAGLGMELDWDLPDGWHVGEPLYPVPQPLMISGLMNHIYEGEYAVLVPVEVPLDAPVANVAPISVRAQYLACTDKICVPQEAFLTLDPSKARADKRFVGWRAEVAPMLESKAGFEVQRERLRIGIPLPGGVVLGPETHVYLENRDMGEGFQPGYAEVQTFMREGDLLVAEIPLKRTVLPDGVDVPPQPNMVHGILALADGAGVRFKAVPQDVPLEGVKPIRGAAETPPLSYLLLGALVGGLLLNFMPCVFPILSLKALALVKAGGERLEARTDALAYTAGVILACIGLGGLLLLLRSAGENIGWAFQLQEPVVVVALMMLATAITANFLGLFEVPGLAISGNRRSAPGSFATGLLAAFVATPCTGPFMAAALGAALLLPPTSAILLFAALGLGLALPFLLIGFVPALRSRLPKPGAWMERFRRWMALPMGLTALALVWLVWRIGGGEFLAASIALAIAMIAILWGLGAAQRSGKGGGSRAAISLAALAIVAVLLLPQPQTPATQVESLHDPKPFSERALAEARTSGRPVFVWFTADWCVTCKVNEQVAIEREATAQAFREAGVITLRGDWTRREPELTRFLTRKGAAGVPLYLWYEPGREAEQLPQVLTSDLLAQRASTNRRAGSPAPDRTP